MKIILTLSGVTVAFVRQRDLVGKIYRTLVGSVPDGESGLNMPVFIDMVRHTPNGDGVQTRDIVILQSDEDVFVDTDAPMGTLPVLALPEGFALAGLWDMQALVADKGFREAYLEIPALCQAEVYALGNANACWGFFSRPGLRTWASARSSRCYRSEQCIVDNTTWTESSIPFIRRGEFFLAWRPSTS